MNVLLLGNGFDIYYKLPTQYINFLNTVDFLIKNYSDEMRSIGDVFSSGTLQCKDEFIKDCYNAHKETFDITLLNDDKIREIISLTKNNIWFSYLLKSFNKNVGWIDFEKETAFVVKAFKDFFENNKIKFNIYAEFSEDIEYIIRFFGFFFEKIDTDMINGPSHKVKAEFTVEYPLNSKNYIIDKEKIAKVLSNELNNLADALKLYLRCFVENSLEFIKEEKNFELFKALSPANLVVTFNYTNTYENFYSNNESYHLHGNINDKIVLGINPDEFDDLETVDTSLLSFKKYFQRTMYETDSEYLRWINSFSGDIGHYTLIVMGHSLDVTDKDIISEMFSNAVNIYILYHNSRAKALYISNLIKIFGKDEFDKLRKSKQLTFLSQDGDFTSFAENTDSRNIANLYGKYC